MEIREVNSIEFNSLYDIDKSAFLDEWNAEIFNEELSIETRKYFGIYDNDIMMGYIGLNIILDECDIIRIAIHKEYQGLGLSKILFEYAKNYLVSNGVSKIMLEVSDKNTVAINLYERLGFNKIYVRENYYSDNTSALIYEMYLN